MHITKHSVVVTCSLVSLDFGSKVVACSCLTSSKTSHLEVHIQQWAVSDTPYQFKF
jgi:hypothetical protein